MKSNNAYTSPQQHYIVLEELRGDFDEIATQFSALANISVAQSARLLSQVEAVVFWDDDFDKVEEALGALANIGIIGRIESNAVHATGHSSSDASIEKPRYIEVACDRCGLIIPKNRTQELTFERQVSRTTGTRRYGVSNATGFASTVNGKNVSMRNSSRRTQSSSQSSGRRHYETVTVLLCDSCHASDSVSGRPRRGVLMTALKLLQYSFTEPTIDAVFRRLKDEN